MSNEHADLSILSRPQPGNDGAPQRPRAGLVPPPRRRWVTRYALPIALIGTALALLGISARSFLSTPVSVRVIPVVVRAGGGAGQATVQAPGWVEADPYPTAVSALTEGVVREVLVLEGEPVKAGQVVAMLVDEDARLGLLKAQAELDERQAMLKTSEATLSAAQQTWDHPVELTRKQASAEAMLAEKEAELKRWPSELEAAEARGQELESESQRLDRLHKEQQASEIEYIRASRQWAAQKAIVESTRARKPVLEAQIAAFRAEMAAASENLVLRIPEQRALAEARAELDRSKAAVERARASRDEARLRLERMEVRSPVAGVVMARLVEPGSKVMMNTDMVRSAHIVRLYDPGRLQVRVDIPLAEAAGVRVGSTAEVVVQILPDQVFKGVVTRVGHEADIQKNTLQVKVAIESPAAELKPEMLARVRFFSAAPSSQASNQSIFAPESLLSREGVDKAGVWAVDQRNQTAERRTVTLGTARFEGWVEVRDGLSAGERLIVDPPADLKTGCRVRIAGEAATAR